MNIYGYTFKVECPNYKDEFIEYTLLIRSKQMIMVEDIVKACTYSRPEFHEQIANDLSDCLPGKQSIRATHCGVEVITKR